MLNSNKWIFVEFTWEQLHRVHTLLFCIMTLKITLWKWLPHLPLVNELINSNIVLENITNHVAITWLLMSSSCSTITSSGICAPVCFWSSVFYKYTPEKFQNVQPRRWATGSKKKQFFICFILLLVIRSTDIGLNGFFFTILGPPKSLHFKSVMYHSQQSAYASIILFIYHKMANQNVLK